MSHFEYISVAMALLYALVVGRLLVAIPASLNPERRYWVLSVYILAMVLASVAQWWFFWAARNVVWTPLAFVANLSLPGALLVQATILTGDSPSSVASFRQRFFEKRVLFFSVGLFTAALRLVLPWINGFVAWFEFSPAHIVAAALAALSIAGLSFRGHVAQAIIALLMLLYVGTAMFVFPLGRLAA